MAKKNRNVNLSKGIVYGFFTIFLIILGLVVTEFIPLYQINHPGETFPIYVNYIPFACYAGAVFMGILLIIHIRKALTPKSRELQSRKKSKSGSLYKEALLITILILVLVPLIGPLFDKGINEQHFSIYNYNWNGASDFKQTLQDEGYEVMAIQSSLSAVERLNKSILLVLLGPNQFYNPLYEIPFFIKYFSNTTRNSILICHDHGSTSTLLYEIFVATALDPDIPPENMVPVTIFPDGILRDNASYDTRPDFPIIESFAAHDTTSGINRVLLSSASSALGEPFTSMFGWNVIGSTTQYAFVDKDGDGVYNFDVDYVNFNIMGVILPGLPTKWPLAGYSHAMFMAKDIVHSRVFVCADASFLNNELIRRTDYDNRQFGINIVNWLTFGGYDKENWVIAFDEAHIRPETSRDMTSAGIFGYIVQYVVHLSTNPITAWIYPLIAIYTLNKYLPKKKQKLQKKKEEEAERREEKEKFRTSSFFAEKIEWYRIKNNYSRALTLLNRRLDRKLNNLLAGRKITTQNVIDMIISKDPTVSKHKLKRISKFMDRMLNIKAGKEKIKGEEDFENFFFEMEWTAKNM